MQKILWQQFGMRIVQSGIFQIKIIAFWINEFTKNLFLENIKRYRIEAEELKEMLMGESDYDEKLAYNPSVLIDFESKVLASHYAEPESFEDFVPDGWNGEYRNFEMDLPQEQRYWLDENGQSLIGG